MGLKPSETVQRFLISSTSHFVAEYEAEGILITHAFPGSRSNAGFLRLREGPLSRSAYMLNFVVPEVPRIAGTVLPDYEGTAERICSLLSLLYGKRFDSHGCVQAHGNFWLPQLEQFGSVCNPALPQNDHQPRSDIAVPLDFRHVARIAPMLMDGAENENLRTALGAAAKFYHQALQNVEQDPEVGYLHLITAGEILANVHHPQSEDLLDDHIRAILDQVREVIPEGERAARTLASQLRQIKRRFRSTIEDLIDDQFFWASRSAPQARRLNPESLPARVSAAYDIRSRYVHTGLSFGHWVAPVGIGRMRCNWASHQLRIGSFQSCLQPLQHISAWSG